MKTQDMTKFRTYKWKAEIFTSYVWLSYWRDNKKSPYGYTQYQIRLTRPQYDKFLVWAEYRYNIEEIERSDRLVYDIGETFGYSYYSADALKQYMNYFKD